MPYAPRKACARAGCGRVTGARERFCAVHAVEAQRVEDARRGSATERYGRGHRKRHQAVRDGEVLCRPCREAGRVTLATQTDHILPIADRPDLTEDRANLQPICDACHAAKSRREMMERRSVG